MRKVLTKKLVVMMLVVAAMLSLAACGGKEKSQVLGKWNCTTVKADGVEVSLAEYGAALNVELSINFDFQEEGKLVADAFGETIEGTYTEDGNKIDITLDGETETMNLEDGKLVWDMEGVTFIIEKAE